MVPKVSAGELTIPLVASTESLDLGSTNEQRRCLRLIKMRRVSTDRTPTR